MSSAGEYLSVLQGQGIQLDLQSRRSDIWKAATAAAAEVCKQPVLLQLLRGGLQPVLQPEACQLCLQAVQPA